MSSYGFAVQSLAAKTATGYGLGCFWRGCAARDRPDDNMQMPFSKTSVSWTSCFHSTRSVPRRLFASEQLLSGHLLDHRCMRSWTKCSWLERLKRRASKSCLTDWTTWRSWISFVYMYCNCSVCDCIPVRPICRVCTSSIHSIPASSIRRPCSTDRTGR